MADLVVIVPSRGRPHAAHELVEAFRETCTVNTKLLFAVDESDPTGSEYESVTHLLPWDCNVVVNVMYCPSASMGQALHMAATNVCLSESWTATPEIFPSPFAIGFMGDDHRPRTVGWDGVYLEALRELGTGIVYGNDLLQRANLPTQVAMTADIIRALGFMAPPSLTHMYFDNFWKDLGTAAGCLKYLPNVVVEHMHPVAGKAAWDEGHVRVNAPAMFEQDHAAYSMFKADGGFATAVRKVRALRGPRVSPEGFWVGEGRHEWRLFLEGTVPVYTTSEWYATREHAPHLEQEGHRERLMFTASQIAREAVIGPFTLVDLGAGDGGLLSLLGPAIKAWGYDLQPSNLLAAKRRGVDVRYGDVLTDEIEWARIAVATEMLEHLLDPHDFIRRIAEHSEILVCSSPRLETGDFHYEFHTWAWDLQGYRALLEQGGWRVKRQHAVGAFQIVVAQR